MVKDEPSCWRRGSRLPSPLAVLPGALGEGCRPRPLRIESTYEPQNIEQIGCPMTSVAEKNYATLTTRCQGVICSIGKSSSTSLAAYQTEYDTAILAFPWPGVRVQSAWLSPAGHGGGYDMNRPAVKQAKPCTSPPVLFVTTRDHRFVSLSLTQSRSTLP